MQTIAFHVIATRWHTTIVYNEMIETMPIYSYIFGPLSALESRNTYMWCQDADVAHHVYSIFKISHLCGFAKGS